MKWTLANAWKEELRAPPSEGYQSFNTFIHHHSHVHPKHQTPPNSQYG